MRAVCQYWRDQSRRGESGRCAARFCNSRSRRSDAPGRIDIADAETSAPACRRAKMAHRRRFYYYRAQSVSPEATQFRRDATGGEGMLNSTNANAKNYHGKRLQDLERSAALDKGQFRIDDAVRVRVNETFAKLECARQDELLVNQLVECAHFFRVGLIAVEHESPVKHLLRHGRVGRRLLRRHTITHGCGTTAGNDTVSADDASASDAQL